MWKIRECLMAGWNRRLIINIAIMALGVGIAGIAGRALAEGNPAHGKKVFAKCAVCHSLDAGKIKIGPPLHGVIGRRAGSVVGFNYSKAMKQANFVWSPEILNKYIASPKAVVPGNRMPFAGLKSEKDRNDLVAFLQELASGK